MRLPSPAAVPLVALSLCAVLLTSSRDDPGPLADDPDPPRPGRILFQAETDDRIEIATVRTDGTGLTFPVSGVPGGHQTNPDWSPDGRWITFVMPDASGDDDLWVARADGSRARMLLECAHPCQWIDDPSWAPDGRRIVVSRTVASGAVGVSTLETVAVRTGRTRVLLGPWSRDFTAGARWSPDSTRIVFERVHKVNRRLDADVSGVSLTVFRLGCEGCPLRRLDGPDTWPATADWSPDGRTIVYSALAEPDSSAPDLFVRALGRAEPRQLTHLADEDGYAVEPTFTADSSTVVFSGATGPDEQQLLRQVSVDGTGLSLATGDLGIAGRHPRVRPDRPGS